MKTRSLFAWLALGVGLTISRLAAQDVPPKIIRWVDPVFPSAMRNGGLKGKVMVEFMVDERGTVTDPVVVESNIPGFNAAAVASILKWKFKPGIKAGRPVKAIMRQAFEFDVEGGRDLVTIPKVSKKMQEQLPPEFQYDTPPVAKNIPMPVYPYELLRDGKEGRATVALIVDETGKIFEMRVREATSPEFGLALKAAINGWSFTPALKGRKPTFAGMKFEHEFNFSTYKKSNELWEAERRLLKLEKEHPEKIIHPKKLDAGLVPKRLVSATFPVDLKGKVERGEAKIEVLVDEQGRVLLPRIRSASEPEFGYAAVNAVSTWLFSPPMAGGQPVITRTIIPFVFHVVDDEPSPEPAAPVEKK